MNPSIACIFPETAPYHPALDQVGRLFDRIVLIRTADGETEPAASPRLASLHRAGRLQTLTPAPLNGNSERFQLLVQDMAARGTEALAQLSALMLSEAWRPDERESRATGLVHQLRQDTDESTEAVDQRLWQASLVLKLAEWSDQQEMEVRTGLERIRQRHQNLFAALNDGDDDGLPSPVSLPIDDAEQEHLLVHRLRAWTRLCLYGSAWPPGLLLTRHSAVLSGLSDAFTRYHDREPRQILDLPIPALDKENAPESTERALLRPALLAAGEDGIDADQLLQLCDQTTRGWPHREKNHDPAPAKSETFRFSLLYFPGITIQQLLAEGCDEQQAPQTPIPTDRGCCIGLLRASRP
jgi:hypothetical protein